MTTTFNRVQMYPHRFLSVISTLLTLCLLVLAGCDSAHLDPQDPEPPAESCGGEGVLCTVSGIVMEAGGSGDGGPAILAHHYWPMDVTLGPSNIIFVVDWNNHVVREIDANGIMTRYIGAGNLGDDPTGPADQLNLNHPTGLTIGPGGDYYLAAWHNWKIKQIDHQTMETISPIGTTQGFLGDGGPAAAAKMDLPSSIVFDAQGNQYVSDQGNQRIRKIDLQGIITTFAGTGQKGFADGASDVAQFSAPRGPDASPGGKLTIDPDARFLLVADTDNNRIRKIDLATGEVTTIAGTGDTGYAGDGGPAGSAQLHAPTDVVITHDYEIFIADSQNHVIRKIDANGIISTVAGTGEAGFSDDATDAVQAKLNRPMGVGYDEVNHTLYIADTFNQQVKRVELDHD